MVQRNMPLCPLYFLQSIAGLRGLIKHVHYPFGKTLGAFVFFQQEASGGCFSHFSAVGGIVSQSPEPLIYKKRW